MKKEDFMEVAKSIKDSYSWIKYLENFDISYSTKTEDIANILYQNIVSDQREEAEKYITQIRLLNYVYKMVKTQYSRDVSFYGLLKSLTYYNPDIKDLDSDEFGGIVEDLIEGSVPRYIEGLNVHCNNEKDWVEFICKPDFNLEDLESGKIKFINEE